jgi:hypothetical protein
MPGFRRFLEEEDNVVWTFADVPVGIHGIGWIPGNCGQMTLFVKELDFVSVNSSFDNRIAPVTLSPGSSEVLILKGVKIL